MSSWLAWATWNCVSKKNSYIWSRPTSFQDFKITSFQKRMFGPKDAQMTAWTLPDGSWEAGTWCDVHCSCVHEIHHTWVSGLLPSIHHSRHPSPLPRVPECLVRLGPAALSELLNFSILILEEVFFSFTYHLHKGRTSLKRPLVSLVTKPSCLFIFFVL